MVVDCREMMQSFEVAGPKKKRRNPRRTANIEKRRNAEASVTDLVCVFEGRWWGIKGRVLLFFLLGSIGRRFVESKNDVKDRPMILK